MPHWIRIMLAILVITMALPLHARDLNAQASNAGEWIYCPTAPEERERRCREAESAVLRHQDLLTRVGAQMHDPETLLVRVERAAGESLDFYQERVKRHQGVATPATNRWIPIRGRYYDPDAQIMFVALDREAYWRYIWEALAPDEALARRTFEDRERASRRYKQRFTAPDGKLTQWRQEMEAARRFRQTCCQPLFESDAGVEPSGDGPASPSLPKAP